MSQTNYILLFKLEVHHSFFEDGMCNLLGFEPSANTKKLFKQFDFKIRSYHHGFGLYINTTNNPSELLKYITDQSGQNVFEFDFINADEKFYSVTDFPIDWLGTFTFDSKNGQFTNENNGFEIPINLGNKIETSSGKILIRFNDLANLLVKKSTLISIGFKSRSTKWNYFIINKSNKNFDNLSISGNPEVVFLGPSKATIQSGEEALLFSSESLLPLSENSKFKLQLVNKQNNKTSLNNTQTSNSSKTVFKGLPNPDPLKLASTIEKKYLSSPMYIYI